jgi:hypothetical protein
MKPTLCSLVSGFTLAAVVMMHSACASSGGASNGAAPNVPRNVITQDQLAQLDARSAYEAVQRLHSNWLIIRSTSIERNSPVQVYVDGRHTGSAEELHRWQVADISRIVHYDPNEATTRWGTGHSSGAIEIITR